MSYHLTHWRETLHTRLWFKQTTTQLDFNSFSKHLFKEVTLPRTTLALLIYILKATKPIKSTHIRDVNHTVHYKHQFKGFLVFLMPNFSSTFQHFKRFMWKKKTHFGLKSSIRTMFSNFSINESNLALELKNIKTFWGFFSTASTSFHLFSLTPCYI